MEEAKRLSGLSHEMLYQIMKRGEIHFEKIRTLRFISLDSLHQYLSSEAGQATVGRSRIQRAREAALGGK